MCLDGVCVKNGGAGGSGNSCSNCMAGYYCSGSSGSSGCTQIPFDECRSEQDCESWENCKNGKCVFDDNSNVGCSYYCWSIYRFISLIVRFFISFLLLILFSNNLFIILGNNICEVMDGSKNASFYC